MSIVEVSGIISMIVVDVFLVVVTGVGGVTASSSSLDIYKSSTEETVVCINFFRLFSVRVFFCLPKPSPIV